MHRACPLSQPAPEEALRLNTAPPMIDGVIRGTAPHGAPNLPPGRTVNGHFQTLI